MARNERNTQKILLDISRRDYLKIFAARLIKLLQSLLLLFGINLHNKDIIFFNISISSCFASQLRFRSLSSPTTMLIFNEHARVDFE